MKPINIMTREDNTLTDTTPLSIPLNFGIVGVVVSSLTAGTVTIKDDRDVVLKVIESNDGSEAQSIGFHHLGGSITLTASADASSPRILVVQQ